jgi:hypothetical protein
VPHVARLAVGHLAERRGDHVGRAVDVCAHGAANVTIRLLGSDDFPPDAKDAAARDLTEAAAQSALSIPVADVIPLIRVAAAHELIEAGSTAGRVLLSLP